MQALGADIKPLVPTPWSQPFTRRAFLRGAGVSLALPWLESLPLRAADSGKIVTQATKPPVRFGCIYFSNGVEPAHWWAKGAGADMEIGPGLQRSEEHTSELQSQSNLVCRLLLEKKKKKRKIYSIQIEKYDTT